MIVGPPKLDAVCNLCGHVIPYAQITEDTYGVLLAAFSYPRHLEELRMLRKVADFYQRNPAMEGKIKPHFVSVFQSKDPTVRKKMFENVPLSEIDLPLANQQPLSSSNPDDQEVIEYLRNNYFRLDRRMPAIADLVERTKHAVDQIPCPQCATGRMRLQVKN